MMAAIDLRELKEIAPFPTLEVFSGSFRLGGRMIPQIKLVWEQNIALGVGPAAKEEDRHRLKAIMG